LICQSDHHQKFQVKTSEALSLSACSSSLKAPPEDTAPQSSAQQRYLLDDPPTAVATIHHQQREGSSWCSYLALFCSVACICFGAMCRAPPEDFEDESSYEA